MHNIHNGYIYNYTCMHIYIHTYLSSSCVFYLGRFVLPMSPFVSSSSTLLQLLVSLLHHPVQHLHPWSSLYLFSSILPSNTSLRSESPLIMCPQKLFCRLLIVSIMDLFSSAICNTSSFVLCSVQLTFSLFLHTHISIASSLLISSFLIVQVSAPYVTTLHTMTLMILFFKFLFNLPLKISFFCRS